MQDYFIARAVKLGTYASDAGSLTGGRRVLPPPGAALSMRRMLVDPRAEPQYGERVPFIIAYDSSSQRLVDCARDPAEFFANRSLRINIKYYISRQVVPVLCRVFDLVGIDVRRWPDELPRVDRAVDYGVDDLSEEGNCDSAGLLKQRLGAVKNSSGTAAGGKKLMQTTIDRYYHSRQCLICHCRTTATSINSALCKKCSQRPTQKDLRERWLDGQRLERRWSAVTQICTQCVHGNSTCRSSSSGDAFSGGGIVEPPPIESCVSIECPLAFERNRLAWQLRIYKKRTQPLLQSMQ